MARINRLAAQFIADACLRRASERVREIQWIHRGGNRQPTSLIDESALTYRVRLGFRGGHIGQVLNHFLRVLGLAGARLTGAENRLVLAICNEHKILVTVKHRWNRYREPEHFFNAVKYERDSIFAVAICCSNLL